MTSLKRYVPLHNNSTNVIGVTNCCLVEFKVHSTEENMPTAVNLTKNPKYGETTWKINHSKCWVTLALWVLMLLAMSETKAVWTVQFGGNTMLETGAYSSKMWLSKDKVLSVIWRGKRNWRRGRFTWGEDGRAQQRKDGEGITKKMQSILEKVIWKYTISYGSCVHVPHKRVLLELPYTGDTAPPRSHM